MANSQTTQKGGKTPTTTPPDTVNLLDETEQSRPKDLTDVEVGITAAARADRPTLEPPEARGTITGEGLTAAWQTDKRVGALWTINQVRNSWIFVTGIGWKKLVNNSESAIMSLNALSAHAKQLTSRVDYREEADGMVYEIYAW
jgi:hypothetical protein